MGSLGLDIEVLDTARPLLRGEFEGRLVLGLYGQDDESVAIFVSSVGVAFGGKPIEVLLIPPALEGPLVTDPEGRTLGTTMAYGFDGKQVYRIEAQGPIPLNGVNVLHEGQGSQGYEGPEAFLLNGPRLVSLTADKIATKMVLCEAGISTPPYRVLSGSGATLASDILDFIISTESDGFAIKGNTGSGGANVRLFENDEVDSAEGYARSLLRHGNTVFIEKRINPVKWKEGRKRMDWNVRALVTLSSNPQWIDAEVRYDVRNGSPVNVCRGAKVAELGRARRKAGIKIYDIKEVAIGAAKAIHDYMAAVGEHTNGFVGLDLIVDKEGPHVIEANSGAVGGFASLIKLRKRPLRSVSALLSSSGPFLEGNCSSHSEMNVPIGPSGRGYAELSISLSGLGMREEALEAAAKVVESNSRALLYGQIAQELDCLGRVEEAEELYTRAIGLDSTNPELIANLGGLLCNSGKYSESIEAFGKVLELRPDDDLASFAYRALGYAYYKSDKPVESACALEKATELDPAGRLPEELQRVLKIVRPETPLTSYFDLLLSGSGLKDRVHSILVLLDLQRGFSGKKG